MAQQTEFIPYEEALSLKELGFDEECMASRDINDGNGLIQLPLYQQAFRWFREKRQLPSWVYTSNNQKYWYSVLKDGRMIVADYKPFKSYEEAELACLRKLIEIVKNK